MIRNHIPGALVIFTFILSSSFHLNSISVASAADSKYGLKKVTGELDRAISTEDPGKIAKVIRRLSRKDDPKSVKLLIEAAIRVPSAKNYQKALKALSRFKESETIDEMIKMSSKARDFRHRVLILESFGKRKDVKTREAIYASLQSKVIQAKVAAILACVDRKEKEAVPKLIDLVEKERNPPFENWY